MCVQKQECEWRKGVWMNGAQMSQAGVDTWIRGYVDMWIRRVAAKRVEEEVDARVADSCDDQPQDRDHPQH